MDSVPPPQETGQSFVGKTVCYCSMIDLSWHFCITNDHGNVPLVCKHFPVLSSFMIYHGFVTRLTRQEPLVEQELLTIPERLS